MRRVWVKKGNPTMSEDTSDKTRPLSPHLQVYRPQITSILSITHRMTGVALALGTVLLVLWLVALAWGPDAFGFVQRIIASEVGRTILFGFVFALFYHLCNGIRHLAWDAGAGYELKHLRLSGAVVVLAALGLTLAAFSYGYALIGKGPF